MTIKCKAVYEAGVLRPTEAVNLPEHARVEVINDLDSESVQAGVPGPSTGEPPARRILGLNRGKLEYIADDFDAPLEFQA